MSYNYIFSSSARSGSIAVLPTIPTSPLSLLIPIVQSPGPLSSIKPFYTFSYRNFPYPITPISLIRRPNHFHWLRVFFTRYSLSQPPSYRNLFKYLFFSSLTRRNIAEIVQRLCRGYYHAAEQLRSKETTSAQPLRDLCATILQRLWNAGFS